MNTFIQDGSDIDQLIYADWLADQGLSDLASDARLDILESNDDSNWTYDYRWNNGTEVGGGGGRVVGGRIGLGIGSTAVGGAELGGLGGVGIGGSRVGGGTGLSIRVGGM